MSVQLRFGCDMKDCSAFFETPPVKSMSTDIMAVIAVDRHGWLFGIDRHGHASGRLTHDLVACYCPDHAEQARAIKTLTVNIVGYELADGTVVRPPKERP